GIFQGREFQAECHTPAIWHFEFGVHRPALVTLADFLEIFIKIRANFWQNGRQRLADGILDSASENVSGSAVESRHRVLSVGGDAAATDGVEHIGNDFLDLSDFRQTGLYLHEQAGIFDGNRRLVSESYQNVLLPLRK